ncbi:bifunctional demethylmenaquinone methyltransferase/2-methoxy-6-polyprenyl-1,4-benzoquinol methylase UbiE [Bacteroidota bacterium]
MSLKVREMFKGIAGHYDFMNDLLSLGIHKSWRKKAVALSSAKKNDSVLDCASGTGDLAIEFKKVVGNQGKVVATDFCTDMLIIADKKFKKNVWSIKTQIEDVMNLSYKDNTFDISSIAFGIRNVDSPKKGLEEMARIVKQSGEVVVLEFGQPYGLLSIIYKLYSKVVIPVLGKFFAGNKFAYDYLQETAARFPCREEFVDIMKSTGKFESVKYYPVTSGIAYIYIGKVK